MRREKEDGGRKSLYESFAEDKKTHMNKMTFSADDLEEEKNGNALLSSDIFKYLKGHNRPLTFNKRDVYRNEVDMFNERYVGKGIPLSKREKRKHEMD